MKRTLLIIALVLTQVSFAGTKSYEKKMQSAYDLMEAQKFEEAKSAFKKLSDKYDDNWLPSYYVALIDITQCFYGLESESYYSWLEEAQTFLDKSEVLSPDNPEILVLQAMSHTCYIIKDREKYGPILPGTIYGIYEQAIQIAPNNPRVVLCKAEWDMGAAMYFGKDPKELCPDIQKSIELFSTFKNETPFYPKWGLERAEFVISECK